MAKKIRKIEEVNKEQNIIFEEDATLNTKETDVENDNDATEEDVLDDNVAIETKKEEHIVEELKKEEKKTEENPYKKKMTQRFFGNYIWNGMITDVIIPKQNK